MKVDRCSGDAAGPCGGVADGRRRKTGACGETCYCWSPRHGGEGGFGGEAGGASFTLEGVADAAEADGSAKASVGAVPCGFLAGAVELIEGGGREGSVAAAEAVGIGGEAFGEFVDPGVADAEKASDANGGPSRLGGAPPLPDELLDDAGFESAAPGKRSASPGGASFLNIDKARLASAR